MLIKYLISFLAAFVAGNMNSVMGGGTFLTYPLLLLMGNTSITANATSTVILWPGIVASMPGYSKEIAKNRKWVKLLIAPCLVGGLIGSFVLTHTPNEIFKVVAPLLILVGSTIFHFQRGINKFFQKIKLGHSLGRSILVSVIVLVVAVYGSYFGAGIGILLLGILSILGIKDIYRNIALKNVLAMIVNFVAVLYFSLSGVVNWHLVPLMTTGAILGGYSGSHLVRHIDKKIVKHGVVVLGLAIALILFLSR